jgi:uncharacterized protein YbjQ (UPF0145 family)
VSTPPNNDPNYPQYSVPQPPDPNYPGYTPPALNYSLHPSMVTTAFELPGYRITRNLGVVRGIVVRSRSVFGSIGARLQTIVGGDITLYTELCEKTREDAFQRMTLHAAQHGANAIIAARYDANELMEGVTEVLAYGTAVFVEPLQTP